MREEAPLQGDDKIQMCLEEARMLRMPSVQDALLFRWQVSTGEEKGLGRCLPLPRSKPRSVCAHSCWLSACLSENLALPGF